MGRHAHAVAAQFRLRRAGGGSPIAPPNNSYPGFADHSSVNDYAFNLTKLAGRHTIKAGYYHQHALKRQNQGAPFGTLNFNNDTNNPLDSQFPFSNAALGIFQSFAQASKFIEGTWIYNNAEFFIQDNWKVTNRLTFDYGMRFVHQQPQYDKTGQSSNFLPEAWTLGAAPRMYVPGCANNVYPCTGTNRQAMDPVTGQFLGPNTTLAIGALVPGTGNTTNGLFLSGQGIPDTVFDFPTMGYAPRFGAAYDVTGQQKIVVRGGGGLFFDRPSGNSVFDADPESADTTRTSPSATVSCRRSAAAACTTTTPPALSVYEVDAALPSSFQWNTGVQMALPWAIALDVSYVGQRGYNIVQPVNINAVDYGAAFLDEEPGPHAGAEHDARRHRRVAGSDARDSRLQHDHAESGLPAPHVPLDPDFVPAPAAQRHSRSASTTSSVSPIARTWRRGCSTPPTARSRVRADQAQAEELLGNNNPRAHLMKGNFIWDLPDLRASGGLMQVRRLHRQRLAVVGHLDRVDRERVHRLGELPERRRQHEPDRIARLRRPRVRRRRSWIAVAAAIPYEQFNTGAFEGPMVGSVGLESGNGYLRGCFQSKLDLSIARNIRLGGGKNIQLRVDMFNAPNQAIVTSRNTTMNLANPNSRTAITNLPYDENGNLIDARSRPRGAGFGVATTYQDPRTVQVQVRFSF